MAWESRADLEEGAEILAKPLMLANSWYEQFI